MTSTSLDEFVVLCNQYYTCYSIAAMEIARWGAQLRPELTGSPNQSLFMGGGPPGEGNVHSRVRMQDAVLYSEKDGEYADRIAKAMFVTLYSEWDEHYRHMIAKELGVAAGQVKSDLMGDVRHVRNWIVHNKSVADEKRHKIKVLPWQLGPGEFKITAERFAAFMIIVNQAQFALVGSARGE